MHGVSQSFSRSTNCRTKRQRRSVPTLFVFVAFFIGITPAESARMVRMTNRQDGDGDDGSNNQRRQKEKGPQFMRNSRPRGSRTQFFSHREFHHEQQQQQHKHQQRRLNPFQIVRPTNKSTPVSVNLIFSLFYSHALDCIYLLFRITVVPVLITTGIRQYYHSSTKEITIAIPDTSPTAYY